jgi:hypothetical protein
MQTLNAEPYEVKDHRAILRKQWTPFFHELAKVSKFAAETLATCEEIQVNQTSIKFLFDSWDTAQGVKWNMVVQRATINALDAVGVSGIQEVIYDSCREYPPQPLINDYNPDRTEVTPRHKLLKYAYSEMLKRPEWQRFRLMVLNQAKWRCSRCKDVNSQLHVHHRRYIKYKLPWEYSMGNMECLCEACHAKRHPNKGGAQ